MKCRMDHTEYRQVLLRTHDFEEVRDMAHDQMDMELPSQSSCNAQDDLLVLKRLLN